MMRWSIILSLYTLCFSAAFASSSPSPSYFHRTLITTPLVRLPISLDDHASTYAQTNRWQSLSITSASPTTSTAPPSSSPLARLSALPESLITWTRDKDATTVSDTLLTRTHQTQAMEAALARDIARRHARLHAQQHSRTTTTLSTDTHDTTNPLNVNQAGSYLGDDSEADQWILPPADVSVDIQVNGQPYTLQLFRHDGLTSHNYKVCCRSTYYSTFIEKNQLNPLSVPPFLILSCCYRSYYICVFITLSILLCDMDISSRPLPLPPLLLLQILTRYLFLLVTAVITLAMYINILSSPPLPLLPLLLHLPSLPMPLLLLVRLVYLSVMAQSRVSLVFKVFFIILNLSVNNHPPIIPLLHQLLPSHPYVLSPPNLLQTFPPLLLLPPPLHFLLSLFKYPKLVYAVSPLIFLLLLPRAPRQPLPLALIQPPLPLHRPHHPLHLPVVTIMNPFLILSVLYVPLCKHLVLIQLPILTHRRPQPLPLPPLPHHLHPQHHLLLHHHLRLLLYLYLTPSLRHSVVLIHQTTRLPPLLDLLLLLRPPLRLPSLPLPHPSFSIPLPLVPLHPLLLWIPSLLMLVVPHVPLHVDDQQDESSLT